MKRLQRDCDALKMIGPCSNSPVKFIVEKSPFDSEETPEPKAEYSIIGRILPNSEIYNESAFQIELKVYAEYPFHSPQVRILTPIYHPNVEEHGEFHCCYNPYTFFTSFVNRSF